MRVKELATWLEAPWEGEGDREIRRVATLEDAGDEDLSFVTHGRAARLAAASRAACLLVADDFVNETRRTVIRTPDPRAAVARAIPKLHPRREPSPGVHPTAVLGPGAVIGKGASIGPLVSIGAGVQIGEAPRSAPGRSSAIMCISAGTACCIRASPCIGK